MYYYTIYKITNKLDNKIYIGKHQTEDLNDNYFGSGKILKRAINKYGIENFTKEILFVFDNELDMNNKEKELVNEDFIARKDVYNLCEGGKGGWGYLNNGSEKHITRLLNMKNIFKNKMKTDKDFREKFCKKCSINAKIAHLQGKIPTKQLNSFESTEKKKDTYKKHKHQQGNKNSQFGTCWITNGIENKKIKKIDIDNWLCLDYYMGRV